MTNPTDAHQELPLVDHLVELRKRILYSIYAIIVTTGASWGYSEKIFDVIRKPIAPYLKNGGLVYSAPIDKFMSHLKVSVMAGAIIACPFWLYQLWKFISPGLYVKERRYGVGFIFFGTLLFCVGVTFCYLLVLPMAFKFLMTFGGEVDQPLITIKEYLSFFLTTILLFGLSFEMPLVLTFLGIMNIISHKSLKDKRRYAVVGIAVISAIITPPDLISMMLMMVPMLVLYEVSVVLVGIFEKKRLRETESQLAVTENLK